MDYVNVGQAQTITLGLDTLEAFLACPDNLQLEHVDHVHLELCFRFKRKVANMIPVQRLDSAANAALPMLGELWRRLGHDRAWTLCLSFVLVDFRKPSDVGRGRRFEIRDADTFEKTLAVLLVDEILAEGRAARLCALDVHAVQHDARRGTDFLCNLILSTVNECGAAQLHTLVLRGMFLTAVDATMNMLSTSLTAFEVHNMVELQKTFLRLQPLLLMVHDSAQFPLQTLHIEQEEVNTTRNIKLVDTHYLSGFLAHVCPFLRDLHSLFLFCGVVDCASLKVLSESGILARLRCLTMETSSFSEDSGRFIAQGSNLHLLEFLCLRNRPWRQFLQTNVLGVFARTGLPRLATLRMVGDNRYITDEHIAAFVEHRICAHNRHSLREFYIENTHKADFTGDSLVACRNAGLFRDVRRLTLKNLYGVDRKTIEGIKNWGIAHVELRGPFAAGGLKQAQLDEFMLELNAAGGTGVLVSMGDT